MHAGVPVRCALHRSQIRHTAAKCNLLRASRRTEPPTPSCVIVCPTQAIIAGDLDDTSSRVSKIIATQKTVFSRKPHKGTEPKLFYVRHRRRPALAGQGCCSSLRISGRKNSPAKLTMMMRIDITRSRARAASRKHAQGARSLRCGASRAVGMAYRRVSVDQIDRAGYSWWSAFLLGFGHRPRDPALSTIPSAAAMVFVALTAFLLVDRSETADAFLSIIHYQTQLRVVGRNRNVRFDAIWRARAGHGFSISIKYIVDSFRQS